MTEILKRAGQIRRFLRRLGLRGLSILLMVEVIIAMVVTIEANWRARHRPFQGFPHTTFDPVTVGQNSIQLFSYGRDLYEAMLTAIDGASESIYLETFIWKDDAVGREFKDHLTRKAAEGVAVYVIFDNFGNLVVPAVFKRFPPQIHRLAYRTMTRPWHLLDPRRYALDHRKLLIVDGHVGFIGGYNLGSLYATRWRDTHLRLEGPAVAQFAVSFADFWKHHNPAGSHLPRHYRRRFDPLVVLRDNDAMRLSFPIRDMYISAIERAEERVLVTNAYFIPDRILRASLIAAAQRGVDVQVLVPLVSNHALADLLARGLFDECLRGGVRIFAYKAMIHAKTCTIDGEWSTIGTANMDRLSAVGNYEINVEIYSAVLAAQMEDLFTRDKANATELNAMDWGARPWYVKMGERLMAPVGFFL